MANSEPDAQAGARRAMRRAGPVAQASVNVPNQRCADVDTDGDVNISDVAVFQRRFRLEPIPEPHQHETCGTRYQRVLGAECGKPARIGARFAAAADDHPLIAGATRVPGLALD
jgi:hypothetical protein